MPQATHGDRVKIHFTCSQEDGTIFDSSAGKEPLMFTIGQNEVLKGLEDAVIGMQQGETKKILIKADEIFGPYSEEKVKVVSREEFPYDLEPVVGMKFEIAQNDGKSNVITVTNVTESAVTLDANHPLAGKNLHFAIQVEEISSAESDHSEERYKKAVDFQNKGMLDEAILAYQKTIELNPKNAKAFFNLGVALQKKGFIDKAIIYYEIAIGLNQEFIEAHHNLGVAYSEKGLFDEALICFQRTVQLNPDHAGAFYNMGNTFVAEGQFQEALRCYQKAADILPDFADAQWAIALLQLRFGNFEVGWKGYEWRWKIQDLMAPRNFSQPHWDGSDIRGKTVLLHAEQGLGDTIQFIRYAPLVARRGANVIVECQQELVSLLKNVEGVGTVLARHETSPECDMHSALLSLPNLFNTTTESIPAEVPYLRTDGPRREKWRQKLSAEGSRLKIGLAWSGDLRMKYGHERYCPLEKFAPLGTIGDLIFYSLQKGGPSRQIFTPPEGMNIIDYAIEMNDFSETAAFIENLDLVIAVDTAVSHLAGALAKPVWVLLPFVADWRWMLGRDDSPWYPTMKLFRQPSRGDWDTVITAVTEKLRDFRDHEGEKP
ncbi:MAG: tetratricopeptide repeat protein [Nitrospirota bacterium]